MNGAVLALTIVSLLATTAFADKTADEAKKLYASGNQHFALAEYEEAVKDFKEAYRRKEDPVFLYDIAQCYRQMPGQEETAIKLYRSYLQKVAATPNREEVDRKIQELERIVAEGRLRPTTSTPQPTPQPQPERWIPPPPVAQPLPTTVPRMLWLAGANGSIPPDALVGGEESGRGLVICHAAHRGGTQSGKVDDKNCNFGYGGVEVLAPRYEVLVVPPQNVSWVRAGNGVVPAYTVIGGDEAGQMFPVCRASWSGGVHPGRVVGANCSIGYGGNEVMVAQYEVLVAPPVAAAPPAARPVEAGPLWNNGHANQTCPGVCARAGLKWNGAWRTTVPNRMSVCDCVPN